MPKARGFDLTVYGEPGDSVYLISPLTLRGAGFLREHVSDDATFLGDSGALAIEARYLGAWIGGALESGIRLKNRPLNAQLRRQA